MFPHAIRKTRCPPGVNLSSHDRSTRNFANPRVPKVRVLPPVGAGTPGRAAPLNLRICTSILSRVERLLYQQDDIRVHPGASERTPADRQASAARGAHDEVPKP